MVFLLASILQNNDEAVCSLQFMNVALQKQKNIPKHSTELSNAKSKIKKYRKKILEKLVSLQTFIKSNVHKEPRADDEASEISTSDMTCSFCQHSTSSDDNDVYLCDYAGCGRMMHRECFKGDRSLIDAGEEEDWFCPYCNTVSRRRQHD